VSIVQRVRPAASPSSRKLPAAQHSAVVVKKWDALHVEEWRSGAVPFRYRPGAALTPCHASHKCLSCYSDGWRMIAACGWQVMPRLSTSSSPLDQRGRHGLRGRRAPVRAQEERRPPLSGVRRRYSRAVRLALGAARRLRQHRAPATSLFCRDGRWCSLHRLTNGEAALEINGSGRAAAKALACGRRPCDEGDIE